MTGRGAGGLLGERRQHAALGAPRATMHGYERSPSSWMQLPAAGCAANASTGWRRGLQLLDPALSAPSSWDWVPTEGGVPELRYAGDKPLPNKLLLRPGVPAE